MSREAINTDHSNGQTAPVAMPDGEPPAARKRPGRPRKLDAAPAAEPTPPVTRPAKAAKAARAPKALSKAKPAAAAEPSPMTEFLDKIASDFRESLLGARPTAKGRAALNYCNATLLCQAAEARRNKAKEDAIKAGVIPDYTTSPFPIGTSEVVYSDKLLSINMKVVAQASRTDVIALIADLRANGVKPSLLARLMKKHSKEFNGAHSFTPSFN